MNAACVSECVDSRVRCNIHEGRKDEKELEIIISHPFNVTNFSFTSATPFNPNTIFEFCSIFKGKPRRALCNVSAE